MNRHDDDSMPALPAPPCVTNEELAVEINRANAGIREIKMALTGNQLGTKGIIPRLDEVEVKQEATDRKLIKWAGIGAGFALALGMIKDWIFHPSK